MRKSTRILLVAGTLTAAYALGAMHLSSASSDTVACGDSDTKKKDDKKDDKRS